jgi:putative transposase
VADRTVISETSVHRYFKLFGLQPHGSEPFMRSTDTFFIEELGDVVGSDLSPPANAPCVSRLQTDCRLPS